MNWTNEDIELVEKFIEIRNKGFYVSGEQLTEVYNRVLNKHVAVTNCGSCLRGRVSELEAALNQFKRLSEKASEAKTEVKVDNTKEEENASLDAGATNAELVETKAVKKAGKGKK